MAELITNSNYQDFTLEMLKTPEGIAKLNSILSQLSRNIAGDTESVRVFSGVGTPESSVAAGVGSLYMRTDGGSDTSVYRKESGSADTGWVAIKAPASLPLSVANGGSGQDASAAAQGNLFYFSATGVLSVLAVGTSGKFLQTQGASANPVWANAGCEFISATTISSAANTGNIAIDNTKHYKVRGMLGALSANDIFWLRFNNSTGAVYNYAFTGYTSAAAAVTGGAEAATKIILGTTVIKPASIATGTTKAQFNFEFNIYPQEIDDTPQVTYTHASGTAEYLDSSSHDNIITFMGKGNPAGGTPITSFRILTAAGATFSGNIYLYEMVQAL